MKFSAKVQRYAQDPFGFMDNLALKIGPVDLNLFKRSRIVARNMLVFSLVMAGLWALLGFDSSPGQLLHVLYQGLPGLIMGQKSLGDLVTIYNQAYGKEMHYSAFVIYGLLFWALSVHYDQGLLRWFKRSGPDSGVGIVKSKNIVYAACVTLLAGGIFELFWQGSFAYFQNQPWVFTFHGGQAIILLQNIVFVSVGAMGLFYMWVDSYVMDSRGVISGRQWTFNLGLTSCLLIAVTLSLVMLWWFYPWPTQQITVLLNNGQVWTSSARFPQTLYTIALDPEAGSGSWFWVENNSVHALNTLVKVFMTMALGSVAAVRKVKKDV